MDLDRLDKTNKDRVDQLFTKIWDKKIPASDIFLSEKIRDNIDNQKVLLGSFDIDKILPYIPYTSDLYVLVCPMCVKDSNFSKYKTLVEREAITPILIAPYRSYPEKVSYLTLNHNHISRYEYYSYRHVALLREFQRGLCPNCFDKSIQKLSAAASALPNSPLKKRDIEHLRMSLSPPLSPDYDLIDDIMVALNSPDSDAISKLINLSDTICNLRSAQAFNAPALIDSQEMMSLPSGISSSLDEAKELSHYANKSLADGLGIQIPTNIDLNIYIDISSDFRRAISATLQKAENDSHSNEHIHQEIMKLNSEIERVKNTNRYKILDASISFYSNNQALINASLFTGAMGMMHGAVGCAAGAAASAVTTIVNKKKWISGGKAVERAARSLENEYMPAIDRLVSAYLGTYSLSTNILSLRKRIDRAAQAKG